MNRSSLFHQIGQMLALASVVIVWASGAAPAAESPARARSQPEAAIDVYRASCLDCHDSDGRGQVIRDLFPKVPDFTDARWQASRTDAELGKTILEGKGKAMPQMKTKLGSLDVIQMISLVRAFQGGKLVVDEDEESAPDPAPPAPIPSAPTRRPAPAIAPAARTIQPPSMAPKPPVPAESSRIFQQLCQRCHGDDGRGNAMRDHFPDLPDFSSAPWHAHRTDAQLTVSILDGKGDTMPSFRGKVTHQQARDLAVLVRGFGPVRPQPSAAGTAAFDARFRQLHQEVLDLRKQVQELSRPAPAPAGAPEPTRRR